MANTMGVTQSANFIPEVWAQRALGKLEAELNLGRFVARDFEYQTAQEGDTVHIAKRGTLQANAKTSGNAVTLQNPTATKVDVSIDNHWEVTIAVEDIAKAQANQDILDGYISDSITVLAEKLETVLAAKYSVLSGSRGSASTNLDEDDILYCRKYLTENRAPKSDRILMIDPDQVNVFLKLERFTSAEKYGTATPVMDGELGRIHGFKVFESILTQTSGSPVSTHNLAMHRNALVLATRPLPMPKAPGVRAAVVERNGIGIRVLYSYNADQLADQVTLDILFGAAALRPEFGVDLIS